MHKASKKILAKNVRALAVQKFGEKFQGKLVAAGVKNGTVTRVLKGETAVGLDVLDALAAVFKVKASELLVDNYNPTDPPVFLPRSVADQAQAGQIFAQVMAKVKASSSQ